MENLEKLVVVICSVFFGSVAVMIIFGVIVYNRDKILDYFFPERIKKREELYKKEQALYEQQKKEQNLKNLSCEVSNILGVELFKINEIETQDEIVRIVNLSAYKTANACVNQEKENRGEKVEKYIYPSDNGTLFPVYYSWDSMVPIFKTEWAQKRNLALKIMPELADRMPHFSQVEPLKTYNENYLQKKKGG
ncbi:MAG: hypothetical protein WCO07_00290 [bacterium]